MKMAKIGDRISWVFDDDFYISELRGKNYSAEVAIVDVDEKHYCVFTDYGQDLIDFERCKIEQTN